MVDTMSKKKRSKLMSRIRGDRTRPELAIKAILEKLGYYYQQKILLDGYGLKPDFINHYETRAKIVIRVQGCFWHRCPLHFRMPKSNVKYWEKHISDNVARDKREKEVFEAHGYKVIDVWEHEIFAEKNKGIKKRIRVR